MPIPWLALAGVLLNEVLYDPAGPDAGREFVELVNVGPAAVPLAELVLEAGDGARGTWRPAWTGGAGVLEPGALLLVGGDSTAAVERLQVDLQNGPDAVRLLVDGAVADRLGYGEPLPEALREGVAAIDVANASLARIPDGADTDDNGRDWAAALPSPGRWNRLRHDLELRLAPPDPVLAWPGRTLHAAARVRNVGTSQANDWRLHAVLRDTAAASAIDIAVEPPRALAAGDSALVPLRWPGTLGLHLLSATLHPADEDTTNDRAAVWVRVGAGSVVVNEILFAPAPGDPEWLELWNRSPSAIDLDGWTVADASGRRGRLHAPAGLAAGALAIALADSAQSPVGLPPGTLRVAVSPWNALNNTDGDDGFADRLVLRDRTGLVHDALRYSATWGATRGRSLERLGAEPDLRGLAWAPCSAPEGVTPGRPNSAIAPTPSGVPFTLAPNPFSPDGDGRDDLLVALVLLPRGYDTCRWQIFDLDGRLRAVPAADRLGPGPRRLVWDGRDTAGKLVERGFYIAQFEFDSKEAPRQRERRIVGVVRP